MKILLSSFVLSTFAALAISAQAEPHEGHGKHLLTGYVAVADALYKDDLAAAKEAAEFIVTHDAESELGKTAATFGEAEDIAAAREVFKKMSVEAIALAESEDSEKYTVMNCPMVKGGGGDWLSADGKVNNPYYGAKMPHCGGSKKP